MTNSFSPKLAISSSSGTAGRLPNMSTALSIRSRSHTYDVVTYPDLAAVVARFEKEPNAFFFADQRVVELYPEAFKTIRGTPRLVSTPTSESTKSYEALTPIFVELFKAGLKKGSQMIIIGGGIAQDMGAFIASNVYRGIPFTLVPTTLLAQSDSCIGGKNSLNVAGYKNMLGSIVPPREVSLVFDVLKTLSDQDILSGLGEIIKLYYLDGRGETERNRIPRSPEELRKNGALARELVTNALEIKKKYVETDEFDTGIRNFLNFGHTFGHAFESATKYRIPHGIAVTLGMCAAAHFSEKLGMLPAGASKTLSHEFLSLCGGYEKELKAMNPDDVLAAMKLDKKNIGQQIVFILTRGAGSVEKTPLDAESKTGPWLREWLALL